MKVFVVISTGASFYWNYATDTFYGDNVCCIYVGFEVILFVPVMLANFSIAIKQVNVFVAIMQLEVSGAHMQVTVSAANMWVTIFVAMMQMGGSLAIMQVVFPAVHYAHDCFCCNYAG